MSVRIRRWLLRVIAAILLLCVAGAGLEAVLEARARARLTADQTFATVNGSRIRYRRLGSDRPGPTVVFLNGVGGSLEQMDDLQTRVAATSPTLSYDRGGYGFSTGSDAYTAEQQTTELLGLLDALHLGGPVILVGYSTSAQHARVFASRQPNRTAGVFLIEPYLPEVELRLPWRQPPRRVYLRWVVRDVVAGTLGINRLQNSLAHRRPATPVEARAQEVLQSRSHVWALAHEWYAMRASAEQTMSSKIGNEPFVIAYTAHPGQAGDPHVRESLLAYSEVVRRSARGKLIELPECDHSRVLKPGPVLDGLVAGIAEVAGASGR